MTLAFIPPSLATSVRMDSSVVMRATPPDQVREALPAQQVPHLAMRPGDGKPNAVGPPASRAASPSLGARARAREAAGNQRPWPADKVERWAIDRLIPYAKNATTKEAAY